MYKEGVHTFENNILKMNNKVIIEKIGSIQDNGTFIKVLNIPNFLSSPHYYHNTTNLYIYISVKEKYV